MYINPTVFQGRPDDERIPTEEAVYDRLGELGISYARVDHEHADTMEDCRMIEQIIGAKICKNLFLCNRQQTDFYLLMLPGDKPFKTKYLSSQLGCSRLSFAGPEHMKELLSTIPGSVSVLELMFDTQGKVRLLIDEDLLADEFISAHPSISTSTVKLRREDVLKFAEACGHIPSVIRLPVETEE